MKSDVIQISHINMVHRLLGRCKMLCLTHRHLPTIPPFLTDSGSTLSAHRPTVTYGQLVWKALRAGPWSPVTCPKVWVPNMKPTKVP